MDGEQRTDDDVTRNVCYNSPFVGVGGVHTPGRSPDRETQQQPKHLIGPCRKRGRRRRSQRHRAELSQETARPRNAFPAHSKSMWRTRGFGKWTTVVSHFTLICLCFRHSRWNHRCGDRDRRGGATWEIQGENMGFKQGRVGLHSNR